MHAEIAEKWIAALESGEYEQGKGALEAKGKFCCLGVLCAIAPKEIVNRKEESNVWDGSTFTKYDGYDNFLPQSVREWAGIRTDNGEISETDGYGDNLSLVYMNDVRKLNFSEIAQVIRENIDFL